MLLLTGPEIIRPHMPETIHFIDTEPEMAAAARRLEIHPILAVDLEADSMFHFNERICLLQIASPADLYVIDPLPIPNMEDLAPVMASQAIRKVFHGADYDVRCLIRDYNINIRNLFDTEIASRFLGYPETGLNAVIKRHFNMELEKKFQKKDWSQRPLPQEMIAYAANDVRYLLDLHDILERELAEKGRLDWVLEECELLSAVRPDPPNDNPLFTRCKGAGRLDPRSLGVLEALLEMRREKARQKDRPPFKIIGHTALLTLAQKRPETMKKLQALNLLSHKQINMHGRDILEALQIGANLPADQLPSYPKTRRPRQSAETVKKIRQLKRWRDNEAKRLAIDPGVFFSNTQIATIVEAGPDSIEALSAVNGLKKWQISNYGTKLLELLQQEAPLE